MKKLFAVGLAVILVASIGTDVALAGKDGNGNGAPNGAHYNLNIIGMQNDGGKNCGPGGHVIFVQLGRNGKVQSRINLEPGTEFKVMDCNALDGPAEFTLPIDVATAWDVYVRALGQPGGKADMYTCSWDPYLETEVCGTGVYVATLEAHGNNNKFSLKSDQLLTVNGVPIFSDVNLDYYWLYDNEGLKLAQLRFYPKPS
jgi:hypothetical protein